MAANNIVTNNPTLHSETQLSLSPEQNIYDTVPGNKQPDSTSECTYLIQKTLNFKVDSQVLSIALESCAGTEVLMTVLLAFATYTFTDNMTVGYALI